DGCEELALVHLRTPLDPEVLGLLVQLVPRSASRSRVGPESSPTARGDVRPGEPGALLGLAGTRAFLVHRAGRDLLCRLLASSAATQPLLDVLVLSLALRAPRLLRHLSTPPVDEPTIGSFPQIAGEKRSGANE